MFNIEPHLSDANHCILLNPMSFFFYINIVRHYFVHCLSVCKDWTVFTSSPEQLDQF